MPSVGKTPGRTRLYALDAAEVSFVPKGMNKKKFLVQKSATENSDLKKNTEKGGEPVPAKVNAAAAEMMEKIKKANPEMMQRVEDCMKKFGVAKAEPVEEPQGEPIDEQGQTALKAVVRILGPFKDKLPAALIHNVLDAAGFEVTADGQDDDAGDGQGGNGVASAAEHMGKDADGGDDGDDMGDDETEDTEKMFMAIPARVESEDDDPFEGSEVKKGHFHAGVEAAEKAYGEHMSKLGYQKYPTTKMALAREGGADNVSKKGEPVAKSSQAADLSRVDPKTREKLELVMKSNNELAVQNKELVKKSQEMERDILAMKAADRRKELVAKAGEFKHLGLPFEDVVSQLTDADRLGKESFERVCKNFSALNEQSRTSGLFGEIGSSASMGAGSNGSAENAWAKIEAGAMGLVQKSAGTGAPMTQAQGLTTFLQTAEGQKLYNEYKSGRPHGA